MKIVYYWKNLLMVQIDCQRFITNSVKVFKIILALRSASLTEVRRGRCRTLRTLCLLSTTKPPIVGGSIRPGTRDYRLILCVYRHKSVLLTETLGRTSWVYLRNPARCARVLLRNISVPGVQHPSKYRPSAIDRCQIFASRKKYDAWRSHV